MEPLAIAGYMVLASTAVSGAMAGTLGGAVAWAFRIHLLWGAALAVATHLAVATFDIHITLTGAALFGGLPLITSLASAWLVARQLEMRAKWHHALATLAGLLIGFAVGLASMIPFMPRP